MTANWKIDGLLWVAPGPRFPPVSGHSSSARCNEAVPPKFYGGTERVMSYLTEVLVDLGHEVMVFASGDSQTTAHLEPAWPRALRRAPTISDTVAPHLLLLEGAARCSRARRAALLPQLPAFPDVFGAGRPCLSTMHDRLDLPELRSVCDMFPSAHMISISDSQRVPLQGPTGSARSIMACQTC